jgi:hypothetical protein
VTGLPVSAFTKASPFVVFNQTCRPLVFTRAIRIERETKMFYSEHILAKKGALSKIWIAAHFERKLSKAQLLQTNIQSSVSMLVLKNPNSAIPSLIQQT